MGNYLRSWRYRLPCFLQRGKAAIGLLEETKEPVSFVIEKEDWAIRRVGENICKEIEKRHLEPSAQPQTLKGSSGRLSFWFTIHVASMGAIHV